MNSEYESMESCRELRDRITDAGLKLPERLTLMITGGCNLHCPHCLLECQPVDRTSPVQTGTIKRIIAEFSGLGGKEICITGGEPLTHPEWLVILRFACSRPGFREVCMQTNAAWMSEGHIHDLLSLPMDKLILQVSLDGATPRTNDLLRGKGQFESTMKALGMLSEAGFGQRIRVAFTEMRHNYDELADAVLLVHDLGLRELVSGTLVKGGRSLDHDWIALPRVSQVLALIDRYRNDPAFSEIYEKAGNIAAVEWFKGRDSSCEQVCTCIGHLFTNASGKVYPCIMYLNDALATGNVHERCLSAVINEALPRWAELPAISRHRTAALAACRDCPGRLHCAGGCVGRAHAVHGDAMSVEDRCELRRAVYSLG